MKQGEAFAPKIEIAIEPVYTVLNSMALLNELEQRPAVAAWIIRTAAALSDEQRQRHAQVFGPLRGTLLLEGDWPDFPGYLAALEAVGQQQIAAHLHELWEQHFKIEWQRISPALENQTRHMQNNYVLSPSDQVGDNAQSIEANLRTLISPQLWRDDAPMSGTIHRVVYNNSAHNGRYVTWLQSGSTLHVFFNALRALPAIMRITPMGRTELVARLAALADETRLSMLALFNHQDTLSAQEIMAQFDLSQSAVSRHIRPLSAFLQESRGKGANKYYSFSPAQLELTLQAIRSSIEHGTLETAYSDVRGTFPEPLRRYMNREGKLTMLPLRQPDRQAALAFIAEQIAPARDYSEKEINLLIQSQIAYDDFVTMRRELYNSRYLDREPDGSRYWKGARE